MDEITDQRTEEIKAYQPYTGPERRMSHSTQNQIIKRKQARIGFILGIIALITSPAFVIGLPCSIIGLVMSIRGLKCKRYGMALAGIILNSAAIISTIVVTAILGTAVLRVAPYIRDQIIWRN